ncbi:sensor histidine kinase [Carboxylicivirga linearis]|uniref:histidine kinase n=1 Tax=Carboxylicivirga linearis TaxID=1628157 RepID=A0ABS5JYT5_9BACT|nr:PAS domain-containing hybrid sensor histidine kinase/response regulator [Carboxylicivirga linearis]MBS2100077.1 PAS domain-containing protein [Carboxylicivirga linearis]
MKRRKVIYFCLVAILFIAHPQRFFAKEMKEIVVLNSYHIGFKWSSDIDEAIGEYFKNDESVRIYNEFMDSKRFQSNEYFDALKATYLKKFEDRHIDGIICVDNKAFEFFIESGSDIWGDIPAVFCGVNNIEQYTHLVDSTRHAIVHEKIDISGTIQLISQMQSNIKEIIAISDQTLSGKIFLEQFIEALEPFSDRISYRSIDATDPEQLKEHLQHINKNNTAIYLLSLYTNRNGVANEMIHESQYFFNDLNIPIYSNWDFLIPNCIVGGKILKGADQGKLSSYLMEKLLNNENTPLFTSPNQYNIFDYQKLKTYHFQIPDSIDNYQIVNKPQNFIAEFKHELIFLLIILLTLLFVITLLISDMIKRKKIELDLIKSEKRLELAVDGASEGLWDIDYFTHETYFNDRFASLLGYSSIDEMNLSDKNWISNIHSEDLFHLREAYQQHKVGNSDTFRTQARLRKKNGQYSWFSILGKITEYSNNTPNRITGVIQNIDQQKNSEYELRLAKDKAEESDRLKSSFLANMSHEIRTPMNAILGFTDLLLDSEITKEEQFEYLKLVKKSGENLLTLINDIIDISKIESGQLKINYQITDLHTTLIDLQSVGSSLIKTLNKSIQLRILVTDINVPFYIKTDRIRLYQIMLNLISNAVKFTETGFIDISYSSLDSKTLHISVKDTGPGISENDQKIIFDRFRQIDESTIKKHGGTGLGLSITKSLTELMNGSITVTNRPQKGAEFIVSLPCLVSKTVALAEE